MRRHPFRRDRHPDAGGHALAQGTGSGLDARHQVVLRMPRAFAAELAEVLDVVQSDGGLAQHFILGIDRLDPGQM